MQSATQAPPNAAPRTTQPLLSAARDAIRAAERAAHGLLFAVRAEGPDAGRCEALEALAVACAGRTSDAGARLAELEGAWPDASPDGPTSAALLSVYEHLASLADGADVPPETAEACGAAAGALAEAVYRVADDAEAGRGCPLGELGDPGVEAFAEEIDAPGLDEMEARFVEFAEEVEAPGADEIERGRA